MEHLRKAPRIIAAPRSEQQPWVDYWVGGCLHYGHDKQARMLLLRNFYLILKERLRVMLNGDLWDCTSFRPRFLGESKVLDEQIETAGQDVKPIADQIDLWLWGNHDARIAEALKTGVINVIEQFARSVGSKGFCGRMPGEGICAIIQVGPYKYPLYIAHTRTGGVANQFKALRDAELRWRVAVYIGGHNHIRDSETGQFTAPVVIDGQLVVQQFEVLRVLNGCFLEDPSYGEEKQYRPPSVGAMIVRFHADCFKVEALRPEDAYPSYFVGDAPYQPDTSYRFNNKDWEGDGDLVLDLTDNAQSAVARGLAIVDDKLRTVAAAALLPATMPTSKPPTAENPAAEDRPTKDIAKATRTHPFGVCPHGHLAPMECELCLHDFNKKGLIGQGRTKTAGSDKAESERTVESYRVGRFSPDEVEVLLKNHRQGVPLNVIAERLGRPRYSVYNFVKNHGLSTPRGALGQRKGGQQ